MIEYFKAASSPEKGVGIVDEEMPFCCGVLVLGEANGDLDIMAEAIDHELLQRHKGRGLLLYTLTQGQKVEAAQLLKAGFESLVTFVSPSTKNTITLYGRKINQPAKRRRGPAPPQRRRRAARVAARG